MIYKTLDISTAHYSQETDDFLWNVVDKMQDVSFAVIPTGTGFIIPVTFPVLDKDDLAVIPSELAFVMGYAAANGCSYIRFDRDGDIIDDLPTWEW